TSSPPRSPPRSRRPSALWSPTRPAPARPPGAPPRRRTGGTRRTRLSRFTTVPCEDSRYDRDAWPPAEPAHPVLLPPVPGCSDPAPDRHVLRRLRHHHHGVRTAPGGCAGARGDPRRHHLLEGEPAAGDGPVLP